mmetsp:Transcript_11101/g.31023  ORF Transcript_11101/g.31023 Transcript_11101/m.31023 type:complete len:155 (+) Transcript_11101:2586-3050(+)
MRPDVELPASQFGPDDVRIAQAPIAVILATLNTPIMNTWDGSVIHPPPYQIGGETLKKYTTHREAGGPDRKARAVASSGTSRTLVSCHAPRTSGTWPASRPPNSRPFSRGKANGLEKHGNSRHRASGRSRWPPLCAARSPCRRMMRRVEARMWR